MRDWETAGNDALDHSGNGFNFNQMGGMFGGGLGALLGSLFAGDPYDKAGGYLDQVPDLLKKYYEPYMQGGMKQYGNLTDQYGQLVNDPAGKLAQFGQGFQADPGYRFSVNEATGAANRAAAAGGMLGSPAEQSDLASRITNMANQNYGNYLNRVSGLYTQGIGGEQGLENQGFDATGSLAASLANYLATKANLAKSQGESQRQQGAGIGGFLGDLAGGVAGGFL